MNFVKEKEIQTLLILFEKELMILSSLSKCDKMKIRKRIAHVIRPALNKYNLTPEGFMSIVEDNLSDVIDLFFDGWGFRKKLADTINAIHSNIPNLKLKGF